MQGTDATAAIRCECGCGVLCLDWFAWDDQPGEGFIEVYTHPRSGGLRYRLGVAWRIVRGKDPWVDSLAFSTKQIRQLHDFLHDCEPQHGAGLTSTAGNTKVTYRPTEANSDG